METERALQYGRIYRLPSGQLVAAHPAMDETMRFYREQGAWDLYSREEWSTCAFPSLTARPDGDVVELRVFNDAIDGYGQKVAAWQELEPTSETLGCEFCGGWPWPGDFSGDGHGEHTPVCPIAERYRARQDE
jgi:hypothetical protein